MTLINPEANLFTALSLPHDLLSQPSLKKQYLPTFNQSISKKPCVYSEKPFHSTNILSFSQQKPDCIISKQYTNLMTKQFTTTQKHSILKRNSTIVQHLINSMKTHREKRESRLDELANEETDNQFYINTMEDAGVVESEIQEILKSELQFENEKTLNNHKGHLILENIIKREDNCPNIFVASCPNKANIKTNLDSLVNPLTLHLSDNTKRVVHINFGKQTYLNVRLVNAGRKDLNRDPKYGQNDYLYISFFNQYFVEEEKQSVEQDTHQHEDLKCDYNASYAQMINEEVHVSSNKDTLNDVLLFPLNLFRWQDYKEQIKTKRPYQQFGTSSDILYLFDSVCVDRIRKYQPEKIIISLDGTTILDPLHFADIIRTLSQLCNNNILFCTHQKCLPYTIPEDVQMNNNLPSLPPPKNPFYQKYMNYELSESEKRMVYDCIISFINVTSGSYVPIAKKVALPSELFRQKIRYDYIQKHMSSLGYMRGQMEKLFPSEIERELFEFALEEAEEQLMNRKSEIPYRELVKQASIQYYQRPIHSHSEYEISREGVLFDILHRLRTTERKYVIKTDKKNSEEEILEEVRTLRFLKKKEGQDNNKEAQEWHLIKLEEYSQVEIISKQRELIFILFNYYNQETGEHEMLFGSRDQKKREVRMNVVSGSALLSKKQEGDFVYVGYRSCYGTQPKNIYFTWPLKINILQNIKSKISGKVYHPEQSDRILLLKIQQQQNKQVEDFSKFSLNLHVMSRVPNKYDQLCRFGARIFYSTEFNLQNPVFHVIGGYSPDREQNTLREIKMDHSKYTYEILPSKIGLKASEIPPLMDYNCMLKKAKDKTVTYVFYDARSPFFLAHKNCNIKFDQKNKEIVLANNDNDNYLNLMTHTTETGMFNVLETYPTNQIKKKYFDGSPRLRYTYKFNSGVLTFDQEVAQPTENTLLYPVEGFDSTYPEQGVYVNIEGNKRKYLNLIFHNAFRSDQPFYMSIDPRTFLPYFNVGDKYINIKREGYKVAVRVKGGRIKSEMEFEGNLYEVMRDQNSNIVKMDPTTVVESSESLQIRLRKMKIE